MPNEKRLRELQLFGASGTTYANTTTVKVGHKGISGRSWVSSHAKTVLMGLKSICGRVWTGPSDFPAEFPLWGIPRKTTVLVGLKTSGVFANLKIFAAIIKISLKVNYDRALTFIRIKAVLTGLKVNRSKQVSFIRSGTSKTGLKVNYLVSRMFARLATAKVGLMVSSTVKTFLTYVRSTTVKVGEKVSSTRAVLFVRLNTAKIGLKVLYLMGRVFARIGTALIGLKVNYTKAYTYGRAQLIKIGLKVAATITGGGITYVFAATIKIGHRIISGQAFASIGGLKRVLQNIGLDILSMRKSTNNTQPYKRTECPSCGSSLELSEDNITHCPHCGWTDDFIPFHRNSRR